MGRLSPSSLPFLGAGIGYRGDLARFFRRHDARIGFFEVMPEHVVHGAAERRARLFEHVAGKPVVTHSVSLSVGTATGADLVFARSMARINRKLRAAWCSDHLSFTRIGGQNIGQLTPIPYTDEALRRVVANVKAVQAAVGLPFLLENISQYFRYPRTDMTEPEFFREVTAQTGCGILLDVTNLRNNAANIGVKTKAYLEAFPLDQVVQLHLAGSEWIGGKLLDTHGAAIHRDVWRMADDIVQAHPVRALLIERDQTFGPLPQLAREIRRGATTMRNAMGAA
ncbi:MAG: DUF692 domain-containing protein [bacterium]